MTMLDITKPVHPSALIEMGYFSHLSPTDVAGVPPEALRRVLNVLHSVPKQAGLANDWERVISLDGGDTLRLVELAHIRRCVGSPTAELCAQHLAVSDVPIFMHLGGSQQRPKVFLGVRTSQLDKGGVFALTGKLGI
ncbi:MAG: hypothetical protein ABIH90_02160 [Candidatus Aenigmatarchaeota archaeon]